LNKWIEYHIYYTYSQHETNDVILYIHSVHKHRENTFQRQNYKMRLKQKRLNWINSMQLKKNKMYLLWINGLNITSIILILCSDRMVVRFTTTFAIGAYHHWCSGFDYHSGRGAQHYVIKFVSDLRQVLKQASRKRLPINFKLKCKAVMKENRSGGSHALNLTSTISEK
jgi:hypothetical protein